MSKSSFLQRILCLFAISLSLCATAQFPGVETFSNSTAPGWLFTGSPNKAYLTAGVIDAEGDGYLRLTSNEHDQSGIAGSGQVFPTHKGFIIEFEYLMYDGLRIFNNPANPTGDGICFFMEDSSVNRFNFHAGGFGGSLGYAQKVVPNAEGNGDTLIPGISKGYIGIGFDAVGNFSQASEGRVGGTPTIDTSSVTIRGPGEGTIETITTDYPWVATTVTSKLAVNPFPLNNEASGRSRDSTAVGWRRVRIEMVPKLDMNAQDFAFVIYLYMYTEGSPIVRHTIFDSLNYNFKPPGYVKLGFSGGTGFGTNIQEIYNLQVLPHDSLAVVGAALDSLAACKNNSLVFDPAANDTSHNGPPPLSKGRDMNRATIDLDTLMEGIQQTRVLQDTGTFTVNSQGIVTFTPVAAFEGEAVIYYSIQDLYGAKSYGAPIKANIRTNTGDAITILKDTVAACSPNTVDLTSSSVYTTTSPGTVTYFRDATGTTPVNDPTQVGQNGIYYIELAGADGCTDIKPVTVNISNNSLSPAAYPGSSCEDAQVLLKTGGAVAGEAYRWWDSETGGNPLHVSDSYLDSTYTTPLLSTTTSYWVEKYLTSPFGCVSTTRTEVKATINTASLAPDAGPDQSLAEGSTVGNLQATPLTTDEVSQGAIGYWRFLSGPASPVIQNSGSNITAVNGLNGNGDYLFTWTVQLNTCSKTDTVLLRIGAPLPVIYTDISVALWQDQVILKWTTAREWNNRGFAVQRSVDGVHFEKIGFVDATTSNSTEQTSYHFEDKVTGITSSRLYYRLQQIDIDGDFAYSRILTVVKGSKELQAQLYPNPFTATELRMMVNTPAAEMVTIRVVDPTGRLVQTEKLQVEKGSSNIGLLSMSQLTSGLYYAEIWVGHKRAGIVKLVKR